MCVPGAVLRATAADFTECISFWTCRSVSQCVRTKGLALYSVLFLSLSCFLSLPDLVVFFFFFFSFISLSFLQVSLSERIWETSTAACILQCEFWRISLCEWLYLLLGFVLSDLLWAWLVLTDSVNPPPGCFRTWTTAHCASWQRMKELPYSLQPCEIAWHKLKIPAQLRFMTLHSVAQASETCMP